jgi:hypothetical protein
VFTTVFSSRPRAVAVAAVAGRATSHLNLPFLLPILTETTQLFPQDVLTSSRKVDECKRLTPSTPQLSLSQFRD